MISFSSLRSWDYVLVQMKSSSWFNTFRLREITSTKWQATLVIQLTNWLFDGMSDRLIDWLISSRLIIDRLFGWLIAYATPILSIFGDFYGEGFINFLPLRLGAAIAVERELIFDVDMTDYDAVRLCCSGADICHKCWPLMALAIKIVHRILTGKRLQ